MATSFQILAGYWLLQLWGIFEHSYSTSASPQFCTESSKKIPAYFTDSRSDSAYSYCASQVAERINWEVIGSICLGFCRGLAVWRGSSFARGIREGIVGELGFGNWTFYRVYWFCWTEDEIVCRLDCSLDLVHHFWAEKMKCQLFWLFQALLWVVAAAKILFFLVCSWYWSHLCLNGLVWLSKSCH